MSEGSKAVFLSYASQDAAAVERLAEALRAAGVEVWFDRNELVGGDAWDAKIRRQIAECALFVPVISANTQARREGYFRIEWRLAAQRTHAMADGTPFLLPVVIDDTRDGEALVPAEFKQVQWTRLALAKGEAGLDAGVTKFCTRVHHVLARGAEDGVRRIPATPALAPEGRIPMRGRLLAIGGIIAAVLALAIYAWKSRPAATPMPANAGPAQVTAAGKAPADTTAAGVERVAALLAKLDVTRAELELADETLAQWAKADPGNARVFAQWAQVDCRFIQESYDRSATRRAAAWQHVAQAASLAAEAIEVRLARATVLQRLGVDAASRSEAKAIFEGIQQDKPDLPEVLLGLAWLAHNADDRTAAAAWVNRAAALPGEAGRTAYTRGLMAAFSGDFGAGLAAIEEAVAHQPAVTFLMWKAYLQTLWLGDPGAARRTLAQVPAGFFFEDMPATAKFFVESRARDYTAALATIRAIPRDFVQSNAGMFPTGYFRGLALHWLDRSSAAQAEWQGALAAVERRLQEERNDQQLLFAKAVLLAALGRKAEAAEVHRTTLELHGEDNWSWLQEYFAAHQLSSGEWVERLRRRVRGGFRWYTAAELRLNPLLDRFRAEPAFAALQAEFDASSKYSADAGGRTAAPPTTAKAVAVLPFKNLSGDAAREALSDGLTEAVADVLGRVPGLQVVGSTSAFAFKGKAVPAPEIARQLGVSHLVEGTVLQEGTMVRVTARLLKADGFQVWVSDPLQREVSRIFSLHDEVGGLIAKSLELKLGVAPRLDREISPSAYQDYLAGRAAVARASMEDLQQALPHFQRAVAVEPKFTAAWVQLAGAQTQLGRWGGLPTRLAWPAARAAIDRAIALEPESPEVLLTLGWIRRTAEWDWRGAEQAFRKALALRPSHPETLAAAAVLLFNLGKQEEAFRLGREAARLDPLNAATQIDLSLMFFFSENWAEAERAARRALQLSATGSGYHAILAWSLIAQGKHAEGEAELLRDRSEIERLNGLGMLALAREQRSLAREHLAKLEEFARLDPDRADLQQSIAWLCAGLGEKDRAFAALGRARTSRDPSVAWSRTMWPLRPLHADPRWDEFLHSLGLADEQLK